MKFNIVLFTVLFCFTLILGNYSPVPLDSYTVPIIKAKKLYDDCSRQKTPTDSNDVGVSTL